MAEEAIARGLSELARDSAAEVWIPLRDTGLRYWVSSHGRVSGPLGVTLGALRPTGYRFVDIRLPDRRWTIGVHRLVCLAFHGEAPTNEHQACHWDGVRDNNRADNLRWGTAADNAADRVRHGTYRTTLSVTRRPPLGADAVAQIRARLESGDGTQGQIARDFGVSRMTVYDIKRGRSYRG